MKNHHPDLHPPLSLHPENGHYFLFRGKPTVLITSAEHYGAVLNLDFDYIRYLDELHDCGLNHTRLWSGTYREVQGSFGITENCLAPAALSFICPWARSGTPGSADGGSKFDLEQWNPAYFERLKDFMREASQRGIVVEMNLFCPNYGDELWRVNPMNAANNVQEVGACGFKEVYMLQHSDLTAVQESVTRKVVEELRSFDNLFYEVCNEPYAGGVNQEWQDHIAGVIAEAEKDFPHRHLISMNIANGAAKVENPNPAVSIFNFHYCVPPETVGLNYDLNKVIGENETGFRGTDDAIYRSEGWDFLIAGGALYNNLDYSFTVAHPDGTASVKAPGGGTRRLRRQLKFLKDFMEGFDFVRMRPDDTAIKGGVPEELTAHALVEPSRQYALYFKRAALGIPVNWAGNHPPITIEGIIEIELQLELPPGRYRAEWMNPVSGEMENARSFQHAGGTARLSSPPILEDMALAVRVEV